MRYSTNLNVIIKAIEKASAHMSRDFIELENLQTNPFSASKFAASCYNRAKQILADEFLKFRPEYSIIFSDGQKFGNSKSAEYSYTIFPVDGVDNLLRANPDFTVAVALEHVDASGKKEAISVAISKIFGGELYYCEKGFGSYLNSRRIRVSKRNGSETLLGASEDLALLSEKMSGRKISSRAYGCRTLEVAYVAASRLEMAIFSKENLELIKPFSLLVREAGGKISEEKNSILVSSF